MKKLLTTTAVLAVLATPAVAADITISGKSTFDYQTWSDDATDTGGANNSKMDVDNTITIKAKTMLDNGMEMGATLLDMEDGAHDADGTSMYIAGDFGKVVFGGNSAADTYSIDGRVAGDSYHGTGTIEYTGGEAIGATNEENGVSYHTEIAGVKLGVGFVDAGTASKQDTTGAGLSYTTGGLTVQYAQENVADNGTANTGETTKSYGASYTANGVTLTLAQNVQEDDANTYDYTGNSVGVAFGLGELDVSAHMAEAEDDMDAGYEFNETAITIAKDIAPGLNVHATMTDYEEKQTGGALTDEKGTSYNFGIALTF